VGSVRRSWKALGEYVLLERTIEENEFGLIVNGLLKVYDVGSSVPIELYNGDYVVLLGGAEQHFIEPSDPTSPVMVHYTKLGAVFDEVLAVELMQV